MTNESICIKIKQRLNKADSNDSQNLPLWLLLESFNRAQRVWCRRNLHGTNAYKEGDESSTSRIDDLQVLIETTPKLQFENKGVFFQTLVTSWPANYMRFKRVNMTVKKDCCPTPKQMIVYLAEEGNVDIYNRDPNMRPDYKWKETFGTITGKKINIYHNNEFLIEDCRLVYYREPLDVEISGVKNVNTGQISTSNVLCEFNDDLIEVLISEAVSILSGDIENQGQFNRSSQDTEKNN